MPGWGSIMGLQFENLVLNNRLQLQKILNIDPVEIIAEGPYFQRKTERIAGYQIDYMIQTRFDCLYVCEIKFSKNEIQEGIIHEIQEKIKWLKVPKHFSFRPVLVHVNGVKETVEDTVWTLKIFFFK